MRPLYEIDAAILAAVDKETGEIIDADALSALQMERERKLEGVALWIKDLKAEARREAWAHSIPMANQRIEWSGAGYDGLYGRAD